MPFELHRKAATLAIFSRQQDAMHGGKFYNQKSNACARRAFPTLSGAVSIAFGKMQLKMGPFLAP